MVTKEQKISLTAIFATLTAIGAYITIPLPTVPATAQTYFVILAGIMLKAKWGPTSMLTYLILGTIGLPVFHAGSGGPGILLGPTGGYIIGFIPAAFIAGKISEKFIKKSKNSRVLGLTSGGILAILTTYAIGTGWLMIVANLSLKEALVTGVIPFIPGDIIKIIGAILTIEALLKTKTIGPEIKEIK